jgi:hypothetical protein
VAYTVSQIITSARSVLQDTAVPFRYSDPDLLDPVNYAVHTVIRSRPDLYWGNYPIVTPQLTLSDAWPLSDVYVSGVVGFVAGWAELRDDEYAEDKRAALLLSALRPMLVNG